MPPTWTKSPVCGHERRPEQVVREDWEIYTIFEGTSEIQRLVIARAVSGVHVQ